MSGKQNTKQMVHRGIEIQHHSVSPRTDPPPLVNHNPAISSVPQGTENLNKSLQADKKP